jgi:hypothetical protein
MKKLLIPMALLILMSCSTKKNLSKIDNEAIIKEYVKQTRDSAKSISIIVRVEGDSIYTYGEYIDYNNASTLIINKNKPYTYIEVTKTSSNYIKIHKSETEYKLRINIFNSTNTLVDSIYYGNENELIKIYDISHLQEDLYYVEIIASKKDDSKVKHEMIIAKADFL